MLLRSFGEKRQLQYLEKYAMLSGVFKFVMKLNSLVHYFGVTFLLMQSNWLSSNYFSQIPGCLRCEEKFITPEKSLCLSRQIIRKASSLHHKIFFFWEVDFLNFENELTRNLYVEYSLTYGFSKISIMSLWRSDASISARPNFDATCQYGHFGSNKGGCKGRNRQN